MIPWPAIALATAATIHESLARQSLGDGGTRSMAAIYYCPVLAFVERCDTFPFLELA